MTDQINKKLIIFSIYLTWLIGLAFVFVLFGFIADWYTFDSFLWVPFEIGLVTSLGMLLIIFMAMAHIDRDKGIQNYFRLLVKNLVIQMTFIVVISLVFIAKLLIL